MIGATYVAATQALLVAEEERTFERSLEGLPFETIVELRRQRREQQEKAAREVAEERRHRELCLAIRSVSFWRFGS